VQRETRERIHQAFSQLSPKYRLVATLALIEEEPYERIADAAGISPALVKVRVFRAVRMLRTKLKSMGLEMGAKR
jgi:RNA polymerase sigma factor (sigma-70 family)